MTAFGPMAWWQSTDPDDALGHLPLMLSLNDRRRAHEQFDEHYVAGWNPFPGFAFDPETRALTYPGQPTRHPCGGTRLRKELILVYPGAWVVIVQPDGSWEAARLD